MQQLLVSLHQTAASVHDQKQSYQRRSLTQGIDQPGPRITVGRRSLSESVPGKIDQAPSGLDLKKIEQSGATRGLAGTCQRAPAYQSVDGRRLAGVRPAGDGDFGAVIARELAGRGGTDQKLRPRVDQGRCSCPKCR